MRKNIEQIFKMIILPIQTKIGQLLLILIDLILALFFRQSLRFNTGFIQRVSIFEIGVLQHFHTIDLETSKTTALIPKYSKSDQLIVIKSQFHRLYKNAIQILKNFFKDHQKWQTEHEINQDIEIHISGEHTINIIFFIFNLII